MNKIISTSIIGFVTCCLLPQPANAQLNNNGATIVMENGAYLVDWQYELPKQRNIFTIGRNCIVHR